MSKILNFELDVMPTDLELGRRVLETLDRHYPGWNWVVDVPAGQNIVVVRNLDCDPYGRMGMVNHKSSLYFDTALRDIMRAGGEFLERYRMRTQGFTMEEIADRIMIFEKPQT